MLLVVAMSFRLFRDRSSLSLGGTVLDLVGHPVLQDPGGFHCCFGGFTDGPSVVFGG